MPPEEKNTPLPDPTPPPDPGANAPPAATAVVNGRTESEIAMADELDRTKRELSSTEAQKKDREMRIAQLEDQLRQLKEFQPPKKSGLTVLDWED